MRLPRILSTAIFFRRLSRSLDALDRHLVEQNVLLTRIAQAIAPADPETDPAVVAADTGVSTVDVLDQQIAATFVERTYRQTGHVPTDEEIWTYLSDEKTKDLHQRLIEREQELDRRDPRGHP